MNLSAFSALWRNVSVMISLLLISGSTVRAYARPPKFPSEIKYLGEWGPDLIRLLSLW